MPSATREHLGGNRTGLAQGALTSHNCFGINELTRGWHCVSGALPMASPVVRVARERARANVHVSSRARTSSAFVEILEAPKDPLSPYGGRLSCHTQRCRPSRGLSCRSLTRKPAPRMARGPARTPIRAFTRATMMPGGRQKMREVTGLRPLLVTAGSFSHPDPPEWTGGESSRTRFYLKCLAMAGTKRRGTLQPGKRVRSS